MVSILTWLDICFRLLSWWWSKGRDGVRCFGTFFFGFSKHLHCCDPPFYQCLLWFRDLYLSYYSMLRWDVWRVLLSGISLSVAPFFPYHVNCFNYRLLIEISYCQRSQPPLSCYRSLIFKKAFSVASFNIRLTIIYRIIKGFSKWFLLWL